jgi:ankyrin repeat protein
MSRSRHQQDDEPMIIQFPLNCDQWRPTETNIKRIDPETGETILHDYCHHIYSTPLEVYRFVIEVKGCDVNVQDNRGDTPLHRAFEGFETAENGDKIDSDVTILIYLLSQCNVDADIKNQYGETLLHLACERINYLTLDVFKVLIETHGFDVNAQNKYKQTPIHYAIQCNSFDEDSDEDSDGDSAITILRYLLSQKNIDANIKGDDGNTLLHYACRNINYCPLDIFKVLIETHGADVNAQDNDDNTPIHCALDCFDPRDGGDINVLAYLINQRGVNGNNKNKNGYTLLHYACIINLSGTRHFAELNAKCDTTSCQLVEDIAERYIQQVLDEATF